MLFVCFMMLYSLLCCVVRVLYDVVKFCYVVLFLRSMMLYILLCYVVRVLYDVVYFVMVCCSYAL